MKKIIGSMILTCGLLLANESGDKKYENIVNYVNTKYKDNPIIQELLIKSAENEKIIEQKFIENKIIEQKFIENNYQINRHIAYP